MKHFPRSVYGIFEPLALDRLMHALVQYNYGVDMFTLLPWQRVLRRVTSTSLQGTHYATRGHLHAAGPGQLVKQWSVREHIMRGVTLVG